MKISNKLFFLAFVLVSPTLLAHHGAVTNGVLYYTDDVIELEGEMTEVFWHNPHTRGRLSVVDDAGEETVWEIELGPGPQSMARKGLAAEDFLGRVRVAGFRSRRGANTMGPIHVLMPNGVEYVQGDRELRWSNETIVDTGRVPDPTLEAEEKRTAHSIFRTWGRNEGGGPERDLSRDWLSERGRELLADYDPVTDNIELIECRQGMPDMFDPVPMRITDEGDRIIIEISEYNTRRTIYMDTATAPEPEPSATGYSTGRWAGETLIVTTTHIDWAHWSELGLPQSDQSTILERLSVSDDGNVLNLAVTVFDPVMFTRPFTIERTRSWTPGIVIPPYNCVVEWED
ncbi:MAG: DUF6152 family protein [Candidatus Rariloculaceae bacterium]